MIKTGTVFVKTQPTPVSDPGTGHAAALSQLQHLAQDEEPALMTLTTLFPFRLFPTTITIEKTKVNIKESQFLGTTDTRSLLIADISAVESESNLLFGTLVFRIRVASAGPIEVRFLSRDQAARARRIVEGLMVSVANKIDLTKVSSPEILANIEMVGASKVE